TIERHVHARGKQVQRGQKSSAERIEIFMSNGRQVAEGNAAVRQVSRALAAVDTDQMSARRQPGSQLLGESLKATVARRNASGSEDGDAHRPHNGASCK